MTALYTKGRLTLGKWASASGGPEIEYVNGSAAEQVFHCQPMASADHLANAQRLVACWNACEGVATEALENSGALAAGTKNHAVAYSQLTSAQRDLADARRLLGAVLGVIDNVPTAFGLKMADRIRAFLKGGA